MRARTLVASVVLAGLCAPTSRAQQRIAIVESVDLLVPFAPTTVPISGTTHVVYELHLTNFLSVDVSVTRVQVLRSDPPNAVLADYRDSAVTALVGGPGIRRDAPSPHVIAPGRRAVVYLWISLPNGSAPRALTHRLELDVMRASGIVHVAVEGAQAAVSRQDPAVLAPPLRGGPWVAIYDPQLKGGHRTAFYTLSGRARIPGRFAVDWIRLSPSGTMDNAMPRRPDWNGNGAEVLAVADGMVASAMDDIPDNTGDPGAVAHKPENASGNYVTIDIGEGRFAFYEHLKRGSVAVQAGDRVKAGQVIGRLGNSGSSSIGPHLHFHVSDANSLLGAEGIPFVFRRFEQRGAFASIEALIRGDRWVAWSPGDSSRRLERPAANAVIIFR